MDGANVGEGVAVTAVVEGALVGSATTTTGGNYVLTITQPEGKTLDGKTVSFTIKGATATQTGTWIMGEVTNLDLTAVR